MSSPALSPARLAIESAAIFLSVFLAFAADQWRDDANDRKRANAALTLVRVELEQNLAELEAVTSSRQTTLDDYIAALDTLVEDNVFPEAIPFISFPAITTIAYELATDSGSVTTVDPADLIVIARAYGALNDVRRNEAFLDNRNAQIRYRDGEQYISGFIYYTNRAMMAEPEAIKHVRAALAVL